MYLHQQLLCYEYALLFTCFAKQFDGDLAQRRQQLAVV